MRASYALGAMAVLGRLPMVAKPSRPAGGRGLARPPRRGSEHLPLCLVPCWYLLDCRLRLNWPSSFLRQWAEIPPGGHQTAPYDFITMLW